MIRAIATTAIVALLTALVALTACGGNSADTGAPAVSPPVTATAPATSDPGTPGAVDGAAVFADNCSGCHSSDGSGGQGPNITAQTDAQHVADQVANGGTSMPAFGSSLSSDQIEAVAEYVTTQL